MARKRTTKPRSEKRAQTYAPVSLDSPSALGYLGVYPSSSGVSVNKVSILSIPSVWRCVSLISNWVGRLPKNVYKRDKQGGRSVDYEHPAQWLITRRPNGQGINPGDWFKVMTICTLVWGNGYAYINRDDFGTATELWILDPEQTQPVFETYADKSVKVVYSTRLPGSDNEYKGYQRLLPENVIHIKGALSYAPGFKGLDLFTYLRDAVGMALAQQTYSSVYFENSAQPGPVVVEMPGRFKDEEEIKQFRESWGNIHQGVNRAHRMAILQNGMKLATPQISAKDAQLIEGMADSDRKMANIFGVPCSKLGLPGAYSYNSISEENAHFLSDGLAPILNSFEEELEQKLLKESQLIRSSHFIEFNRAELQSKKDQLTFTQVLVARKVNGIETQNECREELGFSAVGPDGDEFWMPTTVQFQPDPDAPPLNPLGLPAPVDDEPKEDPDSDQDIADEESSPNKDK